MDKDRYAEARERWESAVEASSEQRSRMVDDLRFSNPTDPQQWDDAILRARNTDPGGARPSFVFDQTNQYISQVVNDSRMNKPQIQTVPASSGANEKVSEALDGLIRQIEYASSASIAYDTAQEHAARVGLGWFRIVPKVVDDELNAQEIRIMRVHDPLMVKYDPDFTSPDGSDQTFGFIETKMPKAQYMRQYDKKEQYVSAWNRSDWVDDDCVRIAEYFEQVEDKESNLVIDDPDNAPSAFDDFGIDRKARSVTEDQYWDINKKTGVRLKTGGQYWSSKKRVKWSKLDGNDFLEETTDFPSQWIPLIPVMGYEIWIEGKRYLCGMVRRMRAGQQAYNMERNAALEWMAKQAKAPFLVPWEAVSEHQAEWGTANTQDRAYLPYDHVDGEGNPIPAPTRLAPPSLGASWQNLGQQGISDLQASVGMYRANLGAPSNETSGIAIKRREQQGDTANFHFQDNLTRSLTHAGRIIVDMIPRLYDTKRAARILGLDGKSEQVIINPGLPEPMRMEGKKVVEINLQSGTYDVRCKTGPAYASLREEAADSLTKIVQSSPQLMSVLGPMWARMQDWPEAERISKLLLAMAPPAVQQLESDEAEVPPKVAAQLQQMQQKIQEDEQRIAQLSEALTNAAAEHDKAEKQAADKQEEQRIKEYAAVTTRLQTVMPFMTPPEIAGIAGETFQAAGINIEPNLSTPIPPPVPQPPMPAPSMASQPAQQPPPGGFSLPA